MTFDKIYQYSFFLLAALWIPFPKLGGLAIVLFSGVVIYGSIKQKLKFQLHPVFIGFAVLYALYSLAILTSPHFKQELPQLEYKLSFVIFPVLFSFKSPQGIERKKLLDIFVWACAFLGLLYWGNAILSYISTGQTQNFHSSWFAYNHHPSYAAAFFSLAIFYLVLNLKNKKGIARVFSIGLILFFLCLHVPLESLAGILMLVCIFCYFVLNWAWHNFHKALFMAMILLGMLTIRGLLFLQPSLEANVKHTIALTKDYISDPQYFIKNCPQKMSGNQARLILWTISGEIIVQHPFGIGISGLDIELTKRLHQLGFHEIAAKHWNPHNQFLQITAELGWFALLWLIGTILLLARLAWRRKDLIFGFIIASFVINALFESMLQRQSGIVFYLLFLSAFIAIINPPKQVKA